MESGETVFIADATTDITLQHVKGALARRKVKSITVVPIKYKGAAIGCIFLRTFKDGDPLSESDIRFTQTVADLTAKALRNAHRYENLVKRTRGCRPTPRARTAPTSSGSPWWPTSSDCSRRSPSTTGRRSSSCCRNTSAIELERLVGVTMAVLAEEAKG